MGKRYGNVGLGSLLLATVGGMELLRPMLAMASRLPAQS